MVVVRKDGYARSGTKTVELEAEFADYFERSGAGFGRHSSPGKSIESLETTAEAGKKTRRSRSRKNGKSLGRSALLGLAVGVPTPFLLDLDTATPGNRWSIT
jgi:hypothetical protein